MEYKLAPFQGLIVAVSGIEPREYIVALSETRQSFEALLTALHLSFPQKPMFAKVLLRK